MKKMELSSRNLRVIFDVPDDYDCVSHQPGQMSLRCCFPSMKPVSEQGLMDEVMDIYLTLGQAPGRVELLVSGDGPVFEPGYMRQTSCLGPIGRYQIYQEDRIQAGLSHRVVAYAFHADDGAVVGVEDPGDTFEQYQYHRSVDSRIHLQYALSKDFGDDFIDIDNTVATFIKSLIRSMEDESLD